MGDINKRILVKISGDLVENEQVLEIINGIKPSAVIHGCGRQISSALEKKGIPFKFKRGIRKTSQKGLEICLSVSNKIKRKLSSRITCDTIFGPVISDGKKIVNTNADQTFRNMIEFYDFGIVFTKSERKKLYH